MQKCCHHERRTYRQCSFHLLPPLYAKQSELDAYSTQRKITCDCYKVPCYSTPVRCSPFYRYTTRNQPRRRSPVRSCSPSTSRAVRVMRDLLRNIRILQSCGRHRTRGYPYGLRRATGSCGFPLSCKCVCKWRGVAAHSNPQNPARSFRLASRLHTSRVHPKGIACRYRRGEILRLQGTIFTLLLLLLGEQAQGFVLLQSNSAKDGRNGDCTRTRHICQTINTARLQVSTRALAAPAGRTSTAFVGIGGTVVQTPRYAAAEAITMAAEADMPVLKVLRVDDVPTVKADPVDPVAREQAKV